MAFLLKTSASPDSGNLRITYSILGVGVIILISISTILAIIDVYSKLNLEVKDYMAIVSAGCITIGLIYTAVSLQYNYQLNRSKNEKEDALNKRAKIQMTYEAMADYHKSEMATNKEIAKHFIQDYKGRLSDPKILKKFIRTLAKRKKLSERKSLISLLNYFEHLSLLIEDDIIDESTIKKAFKTAFISLYSNLKEYIEYEQRGNSGSNARIYENFVAISKRWMSTS